ncbi:hypothetical protein OFY05_00745 [Pseudocitrobacter faecalis]|nr:hypothetical protein OFY05_00745 [Pseudocitrobacter faecalis]
MKERGMIFNAEMVRAILDGRKTQTRRVMKPQPEQCPRGGHWWPSNVFKTMLHVENEIQNGEGGWGGLVGDACPFGKPGDRIWVRETFGDCGVRLVYRADTDDGARCKVNRWTPSIHMPRWASRILLEITDVRVERLNDISECDAKAEGAPTECTLIGDKHYPGFRSLWKSIYGDDSWQANPWVWVIEFKVISPGVNNGR